MFLFFFFSFCPPQLQFPLGVCHCWTFVVEVVVVIVVVIVEAVAAVVAVAPALLVWGHVFEV